MSDPVEGTSDPTESRDNYIPQGAACIEILSESNSDLPIHCETRQSEIEEISALPPTPHSSPTFPSLFRDLYHPTPRRFSTFLAPNDAYNHPQFNRAQRHASLPFITENNMNPRSGDFDFKKLMLDSSRRSSFESAYHSQRSDPASRTPTSSRQEFIDDSNNFTDEPYFLTNRSFISDEQLERDIMERRNSLSYEAIRTYFLERNPYIHEIVQPQYCFDHRLHGSSMCPNCLRRRSSIGLTNLQFRTNAHQAVIERQFEDLSNIPDQRQSRATSIDIFGGIGLPFPIVGEQGIQGQARDDENSCNNNSLKMEGENENEEECISEDNIDNI